MLLAIIYLTFISLGLPDTVLGGTWPMMYQELGAGISAGGLVTMTISLMTVISTLTSPLVLHRFGTQKTVWASILLTALGLMGFSLSRAFWMLFASAVPYGLGAGSIDVALNNYVAVHYKSKHMNWLHCMWGVGAAGGPLLMGSVLSKGGTWHLGYLLLSLIQLVFALTAFLSGPIWPKEEGEKAEKLVKKAKRKSGSLSLPGAKEAVATLACYSILESCTGFWASVYLVTVRGVEPVQAAFFASLFYMGITVGRAFSGFISMKLDDDGMVHLGALLVALGLIGLLQPFWTAPALFGLALMGLGSAPIYPAVIHATPGRFGQDHSQSLIGLEMGGAYFGSTCMNPFFGLVGNTFSFALYPFYLLFFLLLLVVMQMRSEHMTKGTSTPARPETPPSQADDRD